MTWYSSIHFIWTMVKCTGLSLVICIAWRHFYRHYKLLRKIYFILTWNSSIRKTDKQTTAKDMDITGIVTKYLENKILYQYFSIFFVIYFLCLSVVLASKLPNSFGMFLDYSLFLSIHHFKKNIIFHVLNKGFVKVKLTLICS